MLKPSLGWQSWSPPYPHLLHFPRRDYNPRPSSTSLSSPLPTHSISFNYWCSWYAHGWHLNPEIILKEARFIKLNHLNIDCILIDDGWNFKWITALSKQLHQLGFQVGLWYGPFTRHSHLPLYDTLDKLINECELDFLKLDFLYKPYFNSHLADPSKLLQNLFTHLSSHYPHLKTIGCGVPFEDAIGRVSTIRLSKDTAFPPYLPHFLSRVIYEHRVKMLALKYSAWQQQKTFHPDPDVRMFSLDTLETERLWSKMAYKVKGIGDNFALLSPTQIKKAQLWLKK